MAKIDGVVGSKGGILLASEWPSKLTAVWALRRHGFRGELSRAQRGPHGTELFRWVRSSDGAVVWLLHSPALADDVAPALRSVGRIAGVTTAFHIYARDAAGVAASHLDQLSKAGVLWPSEPETAIEFLRVTELRWSADP